MERKIRNYTEAGISQRVTDEMLERACVVIDGNDEFLRGREVRPRYVSFWDRDLDRFDIEVETRTDRRSYKFGFDDSGNITYLGMEGDFKG